jgi:endonuclease III related protein
MISDGGTLYEALEQLNLLEEKPPMWWPARGSFEVLLGAVLTQNAQWTRVEVSLENLRQNGLNSPDAVLAADETRLIESIRPSGLFRNKARVLRTLCGNIIDSYGDFDSFCAEVDRTWLLEQRGIGPETADSILCYACGRSAMVVDTYTARLVAALGYEIETYEALQAWCREGVRGTDAELARHYARFHGMIVEYVKRYKKGKSVDMQPLLKVLNV